MLTNVNGEMGMTVKSPFIYCNKYLHVSMCIYEQNVFTYLHLFMCNKYLAVFMCNSCLNVQLEFSNWGEGLQSRLCGQSIELR